MLNFKRIRTLNCFFCSFIPKKVDNERAQQHLAGMTEIRDGDRETNEQTRAVRHELIKHIFYAFLYSSAKKKKTKFKDKKKEFNTLG